MKVKTFHSITYKVLDEQVNEFIKDKDVVDIKFNVISDSENEFFHFVRVIYRG